MMPTFHDLVQRAQTWITSHPHTTEVAAGAAVVIAVAVIVWFVVFSGLAMPAKFVYNSF